MFKWFIWSERPNTDTGDATLSIKLKIIARNYSKRYVTALFNVFHHMGVVPTEKLPSQGSFDWDYALPCARQWTLTSGLWNARICYL